MNLELAKNKEWKSSRQHISTGVTAGPEGSGIRRLPTWEAFKTTTMRSKDEFTEHECAISGISQETIHSSRLDRRWRYNPKKIVSLFDFAFYLSCRPCTVEPAYMNLPQSDVPFNPPSQLTDIWVCHLNPAARLNVSILFGNYCIFRC